MRFATLGREAAAAAWASKVPTILILLVTAAMCFTAAATTGRNAALQQQVEQIALDAGARVITIGDLGDDGFLTVDAMETIGSLSTVEKTGAVTAPSTFTNATLGWGGPTVSGWGILTDASQMVTLRQGRWPQPGEALISSATATTLRFSDGAGAVITRDQHNYAVVGVYEAAAPFDWLNDGLLVAPSTARPGKEARVTVTELGQVAATQRVIRKLLNPQDPSKLNLSAPRDLANLTLDVGSDVRAAGYETTLLILAVGALFVAAVTLTDVLLRRRDLGRRRALGITRFDLMALICLRSFGATVFGAILGVVAVQIYGLPTDTRPPLPHTMASATLVVIAAVIATIPVGLIASRRDPVSVLRTP